MLLDRSVIVIRELQIWVIDINRQKGTLNSDTREASASLKISNQLASSLASGLEDGNGVNPAASLPFSNWNISTMVGW